MSTEQETIIKNYEPQPMQHNFHAAPNRNKLYGGAMGGGKTRTLCEDMNALMMEYPGNRGLFLRKILNDFMNTTYLVLVEKTLAGMIEAGLVTENKAKKCFNYWNGSKLFYGGLESNNPDSNKERKKYFSAEYGVIGIDEAREITEKEFSELSSRLRHRLTNGQFPPFFMLLASNPSQNWLKTRFISNPGENYAFFPALPRDNEYNPPDYNSQLKETFKHDLQMLEAYVNGSWDSITSIDDLLCMADIEPLILRNDKLAIPPFCGRLTSCDPAYFGDDKTIIYDWAGARVVATEKYGKKEQMETIGRIMHHAMKNKSTVIATDPIGSPGLGSRLREIMTESVYQAMILEVDFRQKSSNFDKWFNLRAEVYWNARTMIKNGHCSLPDDPRLHGQLCSIKYKFVGGGKLGTRIQIESKDKIKVRLGGSPDESDDFVIGLWGLPYAKVNKRQAWRDSYKDTNSRAQSHMAA